MAMNGHDALDAIHQVMSGERWTPETLEAIAEIMAEAGYAIDGADTELPAPGCCARAED